MRSEEALTQIVNGLTEPLHEIHIIHREWPYDSLRARNLPGRKVVALIPYNSFKDLFLFAFSIDVSKSTETHWKLARGAKARLTTAGVLQDEDGVATDYSEETEGWIIKNFNGCPTLEFYRSV